MYKILGINDEVTTCECCGKSGLKRTVVLGSDSGELRYGTACAARVTWKTKTQVERIAKSGGQKVKPQRWAALKVETGFVYGSYATPEEAEARGAGFVAVKI